MAVELVAPANPLESVENLLGPLGNAGVVILFTVFILAGREDLRNRLIRLVGGGRLNMMTQALDEATQRINRYLFLQLLVNSGYGLVVFAGLHFIGIPNSATRNSVWPLAQQFALHGQIRPPHHWATGPLLKTTVVLFSPPAKVAFGESHPRAGRNSLATMQENCI